MKRDPDLIRKILIEIEKCPDDSNLIILNIPGYTPGEISDHVGLLKDAGYIVAVVERGDDQHRWYPVRMTWDGHEFLEKARDDNRWGQAKVVMSKLGGFTFEIASKVLTDLVTAQLKSLM